MGSDAVFDAALRALRHGARADLHAAVLRRAHPRLGAACAGERLAILTNGGGPGVLAADSAAENGVPLARLSHETAHALDQKLPPQWSHGNPVDIIGDAPAQRFTDATAAALADPGVDALLVMYSPVAVTPAASAARAVVEGAR